MKKFKFKDRFFKYFDPIDFDEKSSDKISSIDFSDILPSMTSSCREKLFLRRYSAAELMKILEGIGMLAHLRALSLDNFRITLDIDDTMVNYFKLYCCDIKPENMLFDLRLSETKFIPNNKFYQEYEHVIPYDMIVIEWFSAQNPLDNAFKNGKPQLPGQKKPGLGILKYSFELMHKFAKDITKDGFLDIPDHMHGAVMYSSKFKFFNPAHEGIMRALMRDLKDYSLYDISWGMITETVIEEYKNKPQVYDPSEQIYPVSDRMKAYFESHAYKSVFNKYYKRKRYRFEYDEMVKRRDEILKKKSIVDL